ncbi:MAG: hypothetical protein Fur0018_11630 [Anaerolineales bacterium]
MTSIDRSLSLAPPPRKLPKGYARRLLGRSVESLIGGIFFVVGLPMFCIFSGVGLLTQIWLFLVIGSGVSLIFTALGVIFLYVSWSRIADYIRCYRYGLLTDGKITDVFEDRSVLTNGEFPWVVRYQYHAADQDWKGEERLERSLPKGLAVGTRVSVLYLPTALAQSMLYPPLG